MPSLQLPLPSLQTKVTASSSSHKSKPSSSIQFGGILRIVKTLSSSSHKYRTSEVAALSADVTMEQVEDEEDGVVKYPAEEQPLPAGLRRECMPNHLAVIMDGNVRWALKRGLPASFGHQAGVRALKDLVERCCKWGIRVLTVFAFSSDNWTRPKVEVDFLMRLFEEQIEAELDNFMRENIRVSTIGDSSKLPPSLYKLVIDTEESTKHNSLLHLIVAVSYSGQYDIVQACQSIAQRVKDDLIEPEDIDESVIEQELETKCTEFPYPDLLIRTSGEHRVSNFLLWQMAYTELFFSSSLWPDFSEVELIEALQSFQQRKRRYGGRDSMPNGHENGRIK